MSTPIQELRDSIRSSIDSLRSLQKKADPDDKLILSDVLDKLFTAQTSIIDIQSQYQAVLDENERIKKESVQRKHWQEEKSKYVPFRFFSGGTVMIPKDESQSPYLAIWYCKHCFDKEKTYQLQPHPETDWNYFCPECKTPYLLNMRDAEAYNTAHN